jgi:hypothetical protein
MRSWLMGVAATSLSSVGRIRVRLSRAARVDPEWAFDPLVWVRLFEEGTLRARRGEREWVYVLM